MKLELKHLAPYLPYGLELQFKDEDGRIWGKTLAVNSSEMKNELGIALVMTHENYKPLLRPLSDLTKEIEHNGEKFVPYKALGIDNTFGDNLDDFLEMDIGDTMSYNCIEQLIEWHFDVFGLIEARLAMDINLVNIKSLQNA